MNSELRQMSLIILRKLDEALDLAIKVLKEKVDEKEADKSDVS